MKFSVGLTWLSVCSLWLGCSALRTKPSHSPTVTSAVLFHESTLPGPVPKAQLTTWWNTKLKLGSEDQEAYEFLITTNGQDKRLRVETCLQYTNAIQQGAYALTTADMAMESWFMRAAGTLVFMEKAAPSTHPRPDKYLSRLPVSLVGWNGSDEEAQIQKEALKGTTLQDYARSGKLTKFKPSNHTLRFQTEGKNFAVEELARGDWDGDGIEDALISVTWHYREGSGKGYELQIYSRGTLQPLSITSRR